MVMPFSITGAVSPRVSVFPSIAFDVQVSSTPYRDDSADRPKPDRGRNTSGSAFREATRSSIVTMPGT